MNGSVKLVAVDILLDFLILLNGETTVFDHAFRALFNAHLIEGEGVSLDVLSRLGCLSKGDWSFESGLLLLAVVITCNRVVAGLNVTFRELLC